MTLHKNYDLTTVQGRIEIATDLLEAEGRIAVLEAEVRGLKEQLGAAGYVPRPQLPPDFITEPTYDEPTVPPPPLTNEG
jgi:hypothetical protein